MLDRKAHMTASLVVAVLFLLYYLILPYLDSYFDFPVVISFMVSILLHILFALYLIYSFIVLFKEGKGWPRTVAKMLLLIPIVLPLASILRTEEFYLLSYQFVLIFAIIVLIVDLITAFLIILFDKDKYPASLKIFTIVLSVVAYIMTIFFYVGYGLSLIK